uniref:GST C-terminal domain-containing protein n=1 Tax=Neobodo designis TaxID=312471 RepID=A0A7S1L208_NEODS|mmetsp:Transcript_132/g.491  ORF Transcript_132/g.491 Transcript_132/m.491 type:complete len:275 (+) Transcript_132:232-1056(+)|eukprot:CAMPEP_0174850288 /NCGR_PEP_ID=MMETSP1114-20130205/19146_1 /TAXON_ID=312471 /ORGANISM="Neobodo designis, Strain CCAP 1951/1" /LENGTH=274 /DNA_ID=CAMNT_0016084737 /DNA_START=233 /DNA_END=1057 /DNA_ORIENTATION=-
MAEATTACGSPGPIEELPRRSNCCASCRGSGSPPCSETPVLRVNPVCPIGQRVVIGAALANIPVVLNERDRGNVAAPSVCYRGHCVDGADAGLMYLARRAASDAALDTLFAADSDDDDDASGEASFAEAPLVPATAALVTHARAVLDIANRLATLQLAAASAAPADAKATKRDAAVAFEALERALRDGPAPAGPFVAGAKPSFADAAVLPLVARQMCLTMGACMDAAPRLWALYEAACTASEAVADSIEEHGFDMDAFEDYAQAWADECAVCTA